MPRIAADGHHADGRAVDVASTSQGELRDEQQADHRQADDRLLRGPASTATIGVAISANPKPDSACAADAIATTANTPIHTQTIPASSQAMGSH